MADKEYKTVVSADVSPYEAAMRKMDAATKSTFASINSGASSLARPFDLVKSHLAGITAILAGGAAFKSSIDATKEWGGEQAKLARQLQITTEQAAAWQIAGQAVGITGDQVVTASDKMTKQMVTNAQAFAKLGIETVNSNGSLRSTGEILPEVIDRLSKIKNTTEQNNQGMALFGRSWVEIRGILKISKDALAEAEQKARDLNLVTDPSQLKAYKAAMSDVNLITKSLQIQVGNALLPILTQLGTWMGETGPYVAGAFSMVLRGIGEAVAFVWRALKQLVDFLAGVSAAFIALQQGEWSQVGAIITDTFQRAKENGVRIFSDVGDIWNAKTKVKGAGPADTPHVDLKDASDKKDSSRVGLWQAELDEFKLAQQEKAQAEGRFWEMSKTDERAYWTTKLALTTAGTTENAGVRRKAAETGLAIIKDQFDKELAQLKAQEENYKNNIRAKVAIVEQQQALIAQKYGTESKEYAQVQGEIVKLKREAAAQQLQVEEAKQDGLRTLALGEIAYAQAVAEENARMGFMTAEQLLVVQRGFENERFAIQQAAQAARVAAMESDPDHSPAALQREKNELLVVEQQHSMAIQRINMQIALETTSGWRDMFATIDQQTGAFLTNLVTRQQTAGAAMRSLFNGLAQASAQMVTKMLMTKAAAWVQESALYQAFLGTKNTSEAASAVATAATKAAEADAVVSANAAEGASGGAASVASTPYVGPILAVAAFAAMLALILGAKSNIKSARSGYSVPRGMNPMTQIHEEEMVLPQAESNVIRGLAESGGAGGGGLQVHINGGINDAKSIARFFRDNGASIVAAMGEQRRNFNRGSR